MKNEPILWSQSVINRMFVRTDSKALDANSITKLQWKLPNGKQIGTKISVDLQRFFELRNTTYNRFQWIGILKKCRITEIFDLESRRVREV